MTEPSKLPHIFAFLLFLALILLSCQSAEDASRAELFIPLYSCPSDEEGALWQRVADAARETDLTIVWGIICEEDDYSAALRNLGERGVLRLAYIATNDSQRPIEEIRSELETYAAYPIDGIFFDEVNPDPKNFSKNESFIALARNFPAVQTIVLNAPYASPEFVERVSADTVVIFENSLDEWDSFDACAYPSDRTAVLIHHAPRDAMGEVLQQAAQCGVRHLFVTDRDWDSLPTYFEAEAEALR